MAMGKNPIPASPDFINKLLAKAGLQSLANIPLIPPPEGQQWTKDQVTQLQVEYLHVSRTKGGHENARLKLTSLLPCSQNLAMAQTAKAAEDAARARAAQQGGRPGTPVSGPGSAAGNSSTGANTPTYGNPNNGVGGGSANNGNSNNHNAGGSDTFTNTNSNTRNNPPATNNSGTANNTSGPPSTASIPVPNQTGNVAAPSKPVTQINPAQTTGNATQAPGPKNAGNAKAGSNNNSNNAAVGESASTSKQHASAAPTATPKPKTTSTTSTST